ncbi:MAG: hypothetical protein JW832_06135 [Deltaproteobacteria bacterium]|nr:hypothetical protein [Deltaproteobacteria bacterium]
MPKTIKYDRCFWIAISCACLVFGLLVVPNYDDGNYFYQFYNTIGLRNPFYSDFYGQYFHFMKPTMLLYALLLSGADALSYRILALVQSAEILLCIRLVYLCARRYASKEAAQAGACVFLYLLVAQWALSPLRPETTVVLCCLATFLLCERFQETRSTANLIGASAIAFLVALPMHTCGAIPCIYLVLFALANVQQFSRKLLFVFVAFSCIFAIAGAGILIYPGIASFAESLALFSLDGNRFSGLRGEYFRGRNFIRNPVFSPLLLFIFSVCTVSLICTYKHIRLKSLKQYLNISLFLGAVVIGLGVLPSATWEVYMVYYYPPLVMGFAIAFDLFVRRGGNLMLLRSALVLTAVLAFWCSYGTMPKLYAALCAGGFCLAAVFVQRMPVARLSVLIVVPMLLYQSVVMVSTKIIFDRAEQKIRETRDVVLGGALFVFSGGNVFSVNSSWCGAKTHIIASAEGPIIAFNSVAEERAEQISTHPLVRFFGPDDHQHQKPVWTSPMPLGPTFYGLCNDFSNTTAFLESQNPPLRYAVVKKTALSSKGLDTYANIIVRGLMFMEYSYQRSTP